MARWEKKDQDLYIAKIYKHSGTQYYVYMIIIPSEYKEQLMKVMPEQLSDRAFFLSHDKLDVWQWSEKVYSFVNDMAKSNVNQMEGEKRYEE